VAQGYFIYPSEGKGCIGNNPGSNRMYLVENGEENQESFFASASERNPGGKSGTSVTSVR
jgi:hypothetical protein